MARVAIALTGVTKSFGGHRAVDEVSLEIAEGEFFSLLGPSGCGKTTTLRMIAGFETPDTGQIVLEGTDVTAVPANRRPVNMVFQQYALFPHMSIYENVAFGLKAKRVPRDEDAARVAELLRVVSLEGYENRKPKQLSGAAARRPRPRARQPAGCAPARRAARRARREAAKADAARAQAHPARARYDVRLRDARPGRGRRLRSHLDADQAEAVSSPHR
jgi:ABC-type taurine transport system ATPase subunit